MLERAVILAGEGLIRTSHLPASVNDPAPVSTSDPEAILVRVGITVDDCEKALIFKTLDHTKQNKTRAAELLGISLKTMHNKLKKHSAEGADS